MSTKARTRIIRWTVLVLTVVAFGGSYRHGVEWVDLHTPGKGPGFWEWVTAALPEVMVIVAVLSYPDRPRDLRVWVTGSSAVAWTLWANGASAGPGISGLVVAMWPAWAALTALALMGHPGSMETVQQGSGERRPEVQKQGVQGSTGGSPNPGPGVQNEDEPPVHGPLRPVPNRGPRKPMNQGSRGPRVAGASKVDRVQKWAMSQPTWPTPRAIMDQFPDVSRSTAKRVRQSEQATGTDGTAE